jgi:hypothetical protein
MQIARGILVQATIDTVPNIPRDILFSDMEEITILLFF